MKVWMRLLVYCLGAAVASIQSCQLALAAASQWEKLIRKQMQPMNFSICQLGGEAQANYEKAVQGYSDAREAFVKAWAAGADQLNKRLGDKETLLALEDYRVTAWNSVIEGNELLVTSLETCRDKAPQKPSVADALLIFLRINAASNDFKRAEAFMALLVKSVERGPTAIPDDRQSFVWLYRIALLRAYREQVMAVRPVIEETCANSKDQEQENVHQSMHLDENGYIEYLEKRTSPFPLATADRLSKLFNQYRATLKQERPEVDALQWLRLCSLYQLESNRPHQAMFYAYSARRHGSHIADEVILVLLETIYPAKGVLGSQLRDRLIATSKQNGELAYRNSLDRLGSKRSIAKPRQGSWTGTSIAQGSLQNSEPAVLVSWVNPIGPGRNVLRAGMLITKVGGERVQNPNAFAQAVGSKPVGSVVELSVLDAASEPIGNEKIIVMTTEGWPPSVMVKGACDGNADLSGKSQPFFLYTARDGVDPIDVELDRWDRVLKCKLSQNVVGQLREVAETASANSALVPLPDGKRETQSCHKGAVILYCFNASSAFEKHFKKRSSDKSAAVWANKIAAIKSVYQPLYGELQMSTFRDPVQKFALRGMDEVVNFALEGSSVAADVVSFCSATDGGFPSEELSNRNAKLRSEVIAACK